jgi:hypothetical protein
MRMLESKDHWRISVLVELLDLTFASRTSGLAGSECQIRSFSVCPNRPRLSWRQARLGTETSQEKSTREKQREGKSPPFAAVVGQPAPNSRPGHVLRLPRLLHSALRHRRPRRVECDRTLAGLGAAPRINVSLTLIEPGPPALPPTSQSGMTPAASPLDTP